MCIILQYLFIYLFIAIDSKENVKSDGRITAWSKTRKHFIHRAKPRKTEFELLNTLTLPSSLREPHFGPSVSVLPVHAPTTSSHSVNSPLSPTITPSLFHSRLKTCTSSTNLFPHRLPSSLRTDSTDFTTGPFLLSIFVLCFSIFFILFLFGSVRQTKLASRQLLGAR